MTVVINTNAILPQPTFVTVLGGAFNSGDAGKVAALRLGRALWRPTASLDALTGTCAMYLTYCSCKQLDIDLPSAVAYAAAALAVLTAGERTDSYENLERSLLVLAVAVGISIYMAMVLVGMLAKACGTSGAKELLARPRALTPARAHASLSILSGIAFTLLASSLWHVFQAHLYTGLLERLCGLDVSAALALVPTGLMLTRHEASLLYHPLGYASLGWALIAADLLMCNPAQSPAAGALGALAYGATLLASGATILPGYYLNASAWILLHFATLAGSDAAPGKYDVSMGSATLQVVHAKGQKAGSAALAISGVPRSLKYVHDTFLRPGKAFDVSSVVYLLVVLAALVHLSVARPLRGYLLPCFGTASFSYDPFILLGLWLVRAAWTAIWKGKAVFPCGVKGLPAVHLRKAVQWLGVRGDRHGAKLAA